MILLDSNLLIRMTRSHDPQSGVARAAIQTLVAAMQSYGITRLLRFNATDFCGLAIAILDPAAV